jgi:hypothetical protein
MKIRFSSGGAYEKRGAFFMRVTFAQQKRRRRKRP